VTNGGRARGERDGRRQDEIIRGSSDGGLQLPEGAVRVAAVDATGVLGALHEWRGAPGDRGGIALRAFGGCSAAEGVAEGAGNGASERLWRLSE
jgi:hypothetical protein